MGEKWTPTERRWGRVVMALVVILAATALLVLGVRIAPMD
jgi:hypothetical protein